MNNYEKYYSVYFTFPLDFACFGFFKAADGGYFEWNMFEAHQRIQVELLIFMFSSLRALILLLCLVI